MPPETRKPRPAGNRDTAQNQKQRVHFTSPVDLVLSRLARVKSTGPGTWLASCPTDAHRHGDRSRGLSIRETDEGTALVHCHGGCPVEAVVSALGLTLSDLFPPPPDTYPSHPPRGGFTGKPKPQRRSWPDLFQAINRDLLVCSLAFTDMGNGRVFSPADALQIAAMARHLADEIMEVQHGK